MRLSVCAREIARVHVSGVVCVCVSVLACGACCSRVCLWEVVACRHCVPKQNHLSIRMALSSVGWLGVNWLGQARRSNTVCQSETSSIQNLSGEKTIQVREALDCWPFCTVFNHQSDNSNIKLAHHHDACAICFHWGNSNATRVTEAGTPSHCQGSGGKPSGHPPKSCGDSAAARPQEEVTGWQAGKGGLGPGGCSLPLGVAAGDSGTGACGLGTGAGGLVGTGRGAWEGAWTVGAACLGTGAGGLVGMGRGAWGGAWTLGAACLGT